MSLVIKHHLLPNAQRNWSGVQKSAVDRKRVLEMVLLGVPAREDTACVSSAAVTGSVIEEDYFPPLKAHVSRV